MPFEVQITSNRLVPFSPDLTASVDSAQLLVARSASGGGWPAGASPQNKKYFPPNKPNFELVPRCFQWNGS